MFVILKLVDQVSLFHYGTAVTPPIKGFHYNSIVIRRLSYSNQTSTIGGVTDVDYWRVKWYILSRLVLFTITRVNTNLICLQLLLLEVRMHIYLIFLFQPNRTGYGMINMGSLSNLISYKCRR